MAVHEYRPAAPKKPPRPPFPVPWGLFVVLAIYALLVAGYVWKTYYEAPEYQAAQHYAKALALLGVDDGRSCAEPKLREAFHHVLEAARLMPQQKDLAVHTERLRWRFDERGFKADPEDVRRAELVSQAARRVDEERQPWLVTGSRDRGWAPDQLLAGPERVLWWSSPGFVLIFAVWGYGQFGAKKARERQHEADLRNDEADLERLASYRSGLGEAPRKYADVSDEEDDATQADPPPRPARPSGARPAVARREAADSGTRSTSGGRPAVSRSSGGRPAVSRSSGGQPGVSRSSGGRPAVSRSSGGRPAVKREEPDE
ncbi:MAG: hypothetical protein SFW67_01250 [Myxococcaceae bacterium]|nr:hypothetical protein [Myxococcaceae bacterium]